MIKEPWASPGEGDPGGGAGTDDIRPEMWPLNQGHVIPSFPASRCLSAVLTVTAGTACLGPSQLCPRPGSLARSPDFSASSTSASLAGR